MEIKHINNDDFYQLVELTIDMYAEISKNINAFQAVNTLMHQINNMVNFQAIGLFDDTVLMGFVTGYEDSPGVFHFSGIHVTHKNSKDLKKLIEHCFALVEERGYTAWEVDATNENIASIMEKYGAQVQYTRYRKDIVKETQDG
jgi:hypothetical protein